MGGCTATWVTMGVRKLFPGLTDGGDGPTDSPETHVECRDCGRNLTADADGCPDCGGDVAVYEL